jgi:DNA (cytosine-5)-methyltransferase 1
MIDLFAGCGGLSLGMEQAGFKPLLFSEINKDAAETYLTNRVGEKIEDYRDIYTLTDQKLKTHLKEWKKQGIDEVDLVCGGPPCQGYSGIGHRRTFKVERKDIPSNHLFEQMIRVIGVVRPRMFLFENVKGLLSGRWTKDGEKGEIFRDVLKAFREIKGYEVRFKLVQAKDYGVPQNRPRILLVGIRKDLGWTPRAPGDDAVETGLLPEPTGGAPSLRDVLEDLVDKDYLKGATTTYRKAPTTDFQVEMRTLPNGQVLGKGAPVTEHEYSNHSEEIREKFIYMLKHDGEIPEAMRTKKFAQRVLPKTWGPDGPNITATSLPDDFVHYSQPRAPTVREWARLQCFPDWYQFKGPRTTGGHRRAGRPDQGIWERDVPRYTQIGNAVPVRLARAVGEHFRILLGNGP